MAGVRGRLRTGKGVGKEAPRHTRGMTERGGEGRGSQNGRSEYWEWGLARMDMCWDEGEHWGEDQGLAARMAPCKGDPRGSLGVPLARRSPTAPEMG